MAAVHLALRAEYTGRRLGRAVLAYFAMIVAIITLAPFRFSLVPVNTITGEWGASDFLFNVVMFVPLGFIYRVSRRRDAEPHWWGAIAAGLVLSGLIEGAQIFAPGRFPSFADLAANALGAGLGAHVASAALRRADPVKLVYGSGVDLPLMGFVYLLAPVLWLAGLGSQAGAAAWALVLLTAASGWTIGAVLSSFDRASLTRLLAGTFIWLGVALWPVFLRSPGPASAALMIGLGAAGLRAVAPARLTIEASTVGGVRRRFEAPTLRVALPLFVFYVVISSLTPYAPATEGWSFTLALLDEGVAPSNQIIFTVLGHITLFLVAGYLIAEYYGRHHDRFLAVARPVLGWTGALSGSLEVVRGLSGQGASALMFLLTLTAAGVGGWLYLLQLAHVRALLQPLTAETGR